MQQFTNNRKETHRIYNSPNIYYKVSGKCHYHSPRYGRKSIRDMEMFLLIFLKLVQVWAGADNNDNINHNALRRRDYPVVCRIVQTSFSSIRKQ